ncbi:MAG TPA: ABC transporter permease [Actinomycetes bacterium]|nr:ABC transporter permease [Actinomycetes bacterium]
MAARIAAIERLPMERVNPSTSFWSGFGRAVREVYDYRELLTNLVRKELKIKYKNSILGFLWSLLRPMFLLGVYYIAIGKFLGTTFRLFPVFLFAGLVAWSLFTDVLGGCTGTVVGNAGLIKKVYFPRELLPLSVMGAALVNFVMQMVVLVFAVLLFNGTLQGQQPWLLPLAFVALVLFSMACGMALAAANVYFRDIEHLIEIVLLLWFWLTPIVYGVGGVLNRLAASGLHWLAALYLANPMANVVIGFQLATYGSYNDGTTQQTFQGDITLRLLVVIAASSVLLWLAQRYFTRAQGNFAQEL